MPTRGISQLIFDEITTEQTSDWIDFSEMQDITFFISGYSITTGGTIQIQAESPQGGAHLLHTEVIDTDETFATVVLEGCYANIRAKLINVTDGTFNVSVIARPRNVQ